MPSTEFSQFVAIIKGVGNLNSRCLLRWKESESLWKFVVGDAVGNETLRDATIREVGSQLNLNSRSDFIVSKMEQLTINVNSGQPLAPLYVSFFPVHIYRDSVIDELNSDSLNRWLTFSEICAGKTDSEVIHPQVVNWINRWKILPQWRYREVE